uniref:Uncharacterized protein n=1 Tax=Anguilla anguilla TaxID=7936 RepID=A0A0E9RM48_ANGAN
MLHCVVFYIIFELHFPLFFQNFL